MFRASVNEPSDEVVHRYSEVVYKQIIICRFRSLRCTQDLVTIAKIFYRNLNLVHPLDVTEALLHFEDFPYVVLFDEISHVTSNNTTIPVLHAFAMDMENRCSRHEHHYRVLEDYFHGCQGKCEKNSFVPI